MVQRRLRLSRPSSTPLHYRIPFHSSTVCFFFFFFLALSLLRLQLRNLGLILLLYPLDRLVAVILHDALLFEVFHLHQSTLSSACNSQPEKPTAQKRPLHGETEREGREGHTHVREHKLSNSAISLPQLRRASLSCLMASRMSCRSRQEKKRSRAS